MLAGRAVVTLCCFSTALDKKVTGVHPWHDYTETPAAYCSARHNIYAQMLRGALVQSADRDGELF